MFSKPKLVSIILFLILLGCKKQIQDKELESSKENGVKGTCEIPLQIQQYITENQEKWSEVGLDDFDNDFKIFLEDYSEHEKKPLCPNIIVGDFTNDGNEDFAIIVKDKKEENKDSNYVLLVFNDYLTDAISVEKVVREGAYKEGLIKSVVYSTEENGILSYLEKGNICGVSVIDINYFEKSSFLAYWDKEKKKYQFLNYLNYPDDVLCTIVSNNPKKERGVNGKWKTICDNFGFIKIDNEEVFIEVNSSQIYIDAILKKENDSVSSIFLKQPNDLGPGGMRLDWDGFVKDSAIAKIKYNTKKDFILIDWLGFYNENTKKREWDKDSEFQLQTDKLNKIQLKRCE